VKHADIKRIATVALDRSEDVVRHWLPDGKPQGREWVAINPRRADKTIGSFSVNLDTGAWADFASNDKGGDLVGLVAYLDDCRQTEAAKRLAEFIGLRDVAAAPSAQRPSKPDPDAGPIVPIPAHTSSPPAAHPLHGSPSATWTYRDAEGRAMFHLLRFDPPTGRKQICPLTWWSNGWRWKALPAPRPLYNLDKLAANPGAVALVCEGEKAADAAAQLFPACPTTTAPNGAKSPGKADWAPLKGLRVRIWPDADAPGKAYAATVARLAREAGASAVEVLDLAALAVDPDTGAPRELPAGWDAADALADGWTAERLAELDKAGKLFLPEAAEKEIPAARNGSSKSRFEIMDDGIYYFGYVLNKHTDKYEPAPPLWVCSKVEVKARTRDVGGENWGRLLEFTDSDGTLHRWAMPMTMMAAGGEELRGELLRQGLLISSTPDARRRLIDYLQEARPEQHARCVLRTGWHDGRAFVFPHRTLGDAAGPVLFQSDSLDANPYRERGTLEEWQMHVAAPCIGNSRLAFSISCSMAAALLDPVGEDGGGFHFRGDSSSGKTTALRVAATTWGGADFMQRWRATDNGIEALASMHSDTLLALDELAQMDGRAAGEAAYMLANGSGKSRADRNGGARAVKRWRLLFLSAGEISLSDHMAQAGRRTHAGQEIRMADIPVDAGAGFGAFEELHGRTGGHELSRDLCEAAGLYYGTAGPAFVQKIIEHRHEISAMVKTRMTAFAEENLPGSASGQARRAAARFGLVVAAGEIATRWGLTGWPVGEAERAAARCFGDWLKARGGAGNLEVTTLLQQVRKFFELHGESRFSPWVRATDDHAPRTSNRAGFVRKEDDLDDALTYYVLPEVFRVEVVAGHDYREAERILLERGWIKPDTDKRATRKVRLPGYAKPTRCYVLPLSQLTD